jgi:hypothetical protein
VRINPKSESTAPGLNPGSNVLYFCITAGRSSLREYFVKWATRTYVACLYLSLPLMPLLASLVFFRKKYLLQYITTIKKLVVHIEALREGPVSHYFGDVMGNVSAVPADIHGHCAQCGNCCLDRRCVFLEKKGDAEYQCGIYHSPFRRFSNCGSFPLNQHDIERYECPSYFVPESVPIRFVPNMNRIQTAK